MQGQAARQRLVSIARVFLRGVFWLLVPAVAMAVFSDIIPLGLLTGLMAASVLLRRLQLLIILIPVTGFVTHRLMHPDWLALVLVILLLPIGWAGAERRKKLAFPIGGRILL